MVKTQTSAIKFTVEDYLSLSECESQRYELLGGDILMTPSPTSKHQWISWKLNDQLSQFIKSKSLGVVFYAPLDVVFSNEDVVQPDILFIVNERVDIIHEKAIHGVPDLIIEILSPATARRDRGHKRTLYARVGVKEYWLVDPKTKTIEVLSLREKGYKLAGHYEQDQVLSSPLLTGLEIPLDEVFE